MFSFLDTLVMLKYLDVDVGWDVSCVELQWGLDRMNGLQRIGRGGGPAMAQ
jgi:hypothetical protein